MKPRSFRWAGAIGLLLASLVTTPPMAQEETPPSSSTRAQLDAIRQDLVSLEFERALSAVDALLNDPAVNGKERIEGLRLRSQIHGALGDFDAVEQDYREILGANPGFQPDPTLTPGKAMERFRKVRKKTIGTAQVSVQPPQAALSVDGRPVTPGPDGSLALLVGERVLRAEADGYDAEELRLEVEPDTETTVAIRLVPNARTVVLRTALPDVEVKLDGEVVGVTRRVARSSSAPGVLVLEDLPLGEHTFEFSRRCYSKRRFTDLLSVDLMEQTPKEYETVELAAARTLLTLSGGPAGAEVRVEGEIVGTLPVAPLAVCPGDVDVDVRAGGRVVWHERLTLDENQPASREIRGRPNVALVGRDAWPGELSAYADAVSWRAGPALPSGADLAPGGVWPDLDLPPDTDLVVAVVEGRRGSPARWLLYSPLLGTVETLEPGAPALERPRWQVPAWGMALADSRLFGSARVVAVAPGGPAAQAGLRVGDRIVAVAGRSLEAAAEVRRGLAAQTPTAPVSVQLVGPTGEPRDATLRGSPSPWLLPGAGLQGTPSGWLAAWAAVDAAADPGLRPSALANLALLLSRQGLPERAVEVWGRVRWGDRPGVGDGTAAYFVGRDLRRLGREDDAIRALQRAASSANTLGDDDGPPVAPAARDHLTDLGVALD